MSRPSQAWWSGTARAASRPWFARQLLGALALFALPAPIACGGGGERLGSFAITTHGPDGLRLLTRAVRSEGKGAVYGDFYYAELKGGQWSAEAVEVLTGEIDRSGFPVPHRLVEVASDQVYLVASSAAGLEIWSRAAGRWQRAAPEPGLPAGALAELGVRHRELREAWAGAGGVLRVLSGSWLFEVREARIVAALEAPDPCPRDGSCLFSPTGDTTGRAALYEREVGVTVSELGCTEDGCTFAPTEIHLGTGDPGGSTGPGRRVFFHTAAGAPVLVRPVEPPSGSRFAVQANWPEGELILFEEGAYYIGAAPSASGFVVAVHTYGGEAWLVAVDDAGDIRAVSLGDYESNSAQEPIGVLVVPGGAGAEIAHVFLATGSTTFDQVMIDLATLSVDRRSVDLAGAGRADIRR